MKFILVLFCRLLNQNSHLWPVTINTKPPYEPIRTLSQNIWWVPGTGKHAPGVRRGKTFNVLSTKCGKTCGLCKGRENTLCSVSFISDWWKSVFSLINYEACCLKLLDYFSLLFFPSFMTTLPSVMYFVIVTEFTTALPCVPRDRKPIDSRWACAAFWDGTVAVQDKLYACQSDPWYNTGTIHLPTIFFHTFTSSISDVQRSSHKGFAVLGQFCAKIITLRL